MWAGASSWIAALALLPVLGACNEPLAPPGAKKKPPPAAPGDAAVAIVIDATATPAVGDAAIVARAPDAAIEEPPAPFYTVADALADAKASPLKRLGIGEWFGNASIKACVYRNDRVFVVDVYCTYKEQPAFSVIVMSPAKGKVLIYAEANDPISTVERKDYFDFYAESYPPLAKLPIPALDKATFADVNDWEEQSYNTRLPLEGFGACSTGMANCADPTWLEPAHAFIDAPSADWKWIVDQLRNRAQHDGKYVGKKGGK